MPAGCHDAGVGSKRERQADRALVAAYHEARLGELVERVAAAVDRFRAGELDAFAVDEVIHQYHRAARELWKFCWLGGSGAGVELHRSRLARHGRPGRAHRLVAARRSTRARGREAVGRCAPQERVRHRLARPAAPLDLR